LNLKQLILFILIISGAAAQARTGPPANDAEPLRRAAAAITDIMVHDSFSPPVAGRIYLYTSVAAYETMAKGEWREYASLYGQVKGLPAIPDPQGEISFPLAAVYAYLLVAKKLIFPASVMEDSIRAILDGYRNSDRSDTAVYAASLEYGRQVAAAVITWAGTDKIRPVILDSADQFRPLPAPAFSTDTASFFYHQAYEVYQAGNTLTREQKDIANFWDGNPFAVGGHWMSIVTIVSRQRRLDIMETAAAYTITSIAIFDAFISYRAEKFPNNVIRPEKYIDSYIAKGWRSLLQTPPFPEYTSVHSIVSTVSATVLTHYFGDHFAFDDDTEIAFGLPRRHFDSFLQAAQEAALSGFYGGIYYHAAIDAGITSGRQIGQWILNKIILKKPSRPKQVLKSKP
jgi:hypothetical protein